MEQVPVNPYGNIKAGAVQVFRAHLMLTPNYVMDKCRSSPRAHRKRRPRKWEARSVGENVTVTFFASARTNYVKSKKSASISPLAVSCMASITMTSHRGIALNFT